ncbi:MAG: sugar transferase [Acidobacteriota bacterium]
MQIAPSTWPAGNLRFPARETFGIRLLAVPERVAAAAGLLLLSPALLMLGIAIAILSRRSPLVAHTRAGRHGEPLHMLKFRTMWEPGNSGPAKLKTESVSDAVPLRKNNGDARVTSRLAALCRRHSIDELPQLWHVARGEMSFVGPRPITRRELEAHYAGCIDEVLSLRPGMTGLWQVMGRNKLTYARRRRLDLLFVRRASAGLYFRILLRSIPRILKGTGAC